MKHWEVVAEVEIRATRTYIVEAKDVEEAKENTFKQNTSEFDEEEVLMVRNIEHELKCTSFKSVSQIS
jgi:hypothetical protein